jgi:hypothetical protein
MEGAVAARARTRATRARARAHGPASTVGAVTEGTVGECGQLMRSADEEPRAEMWN